MRIAQGEGIRHAGTKVQAEGFQWFLIRALFGETTTPEQREKVSVFRSSTRGYSVHAAGVAQAQLDWHWSRYQVRRAGATNPQESGNVAAVGV